MKYHKTLGFTLLAGTILALGMPAAAGKSAGACEADTAKFCKDIKPGGSRIADCLKEHEKELSKTCSERRAQAAEKRAKRADKRAGQAFWRGWNKGEKGGGKRGFGRGGDSDRQGFGARNKGQKGGGVCMGQFSKGFAQGFQRGFKMRGGMAGARGMHGAKGKKGAHARVCAADTEKLCGDIKPGGGRVRGCLLKNMGKLSDGCKARTEKTKKRLEEKGAEKAKTL